MREQLSPMGTRTAWIQNYKCIFKSVQHFSLTCLLLSKKKRKHRVYSQCLSWISDSFTYGKAFWYQLLNCFPAFLLSVAIGNPAWLCGNITRFPRFRHQRPSTGKQGVPFFSSTCCALPLFLSEKGLQTLRDCENKAVTLKYQAKISLLKCNQWYCNDQKLAFTAILPVYSVH